MLVIEALQIIPSYWNAPIILVLTLVIVILTALLLREQRKTNRLKAREMTLEARQGAASQNPMVRHTFESLPPYTEEHSMTKLTIHNGGNCSLGHPRTEIRCSWVPKVVMLLSWSPDTDFVANEDKVFELPLPEPPRGNHDLEVRTLGMHPIERSEVFFTATEHLTV